MAGFILGIDGGGTTTRLMIADQSGNVTRTAYGEGINPLDNSGWRRSLADLMRPYAAERPLRAVAAALPAYGEVVTISEDQTQLVAGTFGNVPQRVMNDVDAAQVGAFADGPGILLLSGTGSMAWARDADGRSHRAGGWGDVIGDEGSSYWIGRLILSVASQSLDGRAPATELSRTLFQHLQLDLSDPADALEGWVSHLKHPRSEIAALAPLATRLAQAGDAAATAIVERAAGELALHVSAVARLVSPGMPWSYAGGSFSSSVLLGAVTSRVGRAPVPPRLPPIGGALLAAAKLADWSVDSVWIARLAAALQQTSHQAHQLQMNV